MMRKSIIILILAAILPLSCSKTISQSDSRLVVEGWIESGGHPMVLLSESFTVEIGKEIDAADLIGNIAKWARVTVSDGDTSIILTGMVDPNYFPPYVFSTSNITGKVGKTYELRVEYKDYVATAKTTIPEPVPLDTVFVASVKDSTCHVVCGFTDPPQKGNNYKIFTRTTGIDSHYHTSSLALTDDEQLNGYTEIFLYSTLRLMEYVSLSNLYEGDELWVKLCTMDKEGYDFWKFYEVILYANTFNMDSGAAMMGNVNGALGYWIGYGVDQPRCIKLEAPAIKEQ
jgi:hypothetical protein